MQLHYNTVTLLFENLRRYSGGVNCWWSRKIICLLLAIFMSKILVGVFKCNQNITTVIPTQQTWAAVSMTYICRQQGCTLQGAAFFCFRAEEKFFRAGQGRAGSKILWVWQGNSQTRGIFRVGRGRAWRGILENFRARAVRGSQFSQGWSGAGRGVHPQLWCLT